MLRKLLHLETGYFYSYRYQLAPVKKKPNQAWSSYLEQEWLASAARKVDRRKVTLARLLQNAPLRIASSNLAKASSRNLG